ncbi:serine/threonine-protein phosphatase [bacterium]|nr:serine/threonine-protein phosphatase [bacterium]
MSEIKSLKDLYTRLKSIKQKIGVQHEKETFRNLNALCKDFVSFNNSIFTLDYPGAVFGFNTKTESKKLFELIKSYDDEVVTYNVLKPGDKDFDPMMPFGREIKHLYYPDLASEKGKLKKIYNELKIRSLLILPVRSSFHFAMKDHVLFDVINNSAIFCSRNVNAFSQRDIEILFTICNFHHHSLSLSRLTKTLGSYFLSSVYNSPLGMIIIAKDNTVIVCNDSAFAILGIEYKRKKRRKDGKMRLNFFSKIQEVFPEAEKDRILKAISDIRADAEEKVRLQFWYKSPQSAEKILIRMLVYRFMKLKELPGGGGNLEITIAFDDVTNEYKRNLLQRELEIARNVQLSFLPKNNFNNERLETYGVSYPAEEVGGDYYDFIPSNNSLNFVIADVSGKGISASMVMASLKISLQNLIETGIKFENIIPHLNDLIYRNTPRDVFITMFLGKLNLGTRELIYTNSGHNPPILTQHPGEMRFLKTGGTVLGAFPDQTYSTGNVKLEKNDIILCYTDGITESENIRGDQFEEKRLFKTINTFQSSAASRRGTTRNIVNRIVNEVKTFRGEASQVDDITLFALRMKK